MMFWPTHCLQEVWKGVWSGGGPVEAVDWRTWWLHRGGREARGSAGWGKTGRLLETYITKRDAMLVPKHQATNAAAAMLQEGRVPAPPPPPPAFATTVDGSAGISAPMAIGE